MLSSEELKEIRDWKKKQDELKTEGIRLALKSATERKQRQKTMDAALKFYTSGSKPLGGARREPEINPILREYIGGVR